MGEMVSIAVLDSLCEAQMLGAALQSRGIPHTICSHEDLVRDGIFLPSRGWGHVEAFEEHRPAILATLNDIRTTGGERSGVLPPDNAP